MYQRIKLLKINKSVYFILYEFEINSNQEIIYFIKVLRKKTPYIKGIQTMIVIIEKAGLQIDLNPFIKMQIDGDPINAAHWSNGGIVVC